MRSETKRMFGELAGSAIATLLSVGLLFYGCSHGIFGAVLALVFGLPAIMWSFVKLVTWIERPFFTEGCLYTGHLYRHGDGRIDADINPDGQSTRANALLLIKGEPAWLVSATNTNGIANVRRVAKLAGEPPKVKYLKLQPYQLY